MEKFERWTKIIIWRWTNGPIFFTMDHPPHGRIRTLDQEYHFEVDELTDFWRLTVHSMDEFGRKTINSTRWTEVDGQTNDPLTIFHEDYIQLTV